MGLKYFYDFLSQPSRAVHILLKLSNIPFQDCPVALRNGEHLSPEFKEKYNRFQKVPFIHDGDFKLAESVAILHYLDREYKIPDNLYPKDSKLRAKVDEYCEWQHHNIRAHCAMYFQKIALIPFMTGKEPPAAVVEKYENNMIESLSKFEDLFLKQGHDYVACNHLTFADILAACEIEQPRLAGFDPLKGRPILKAWMEKVKKECNPYYNEAHSILNKLAERGGFKSKL